MVRRKNCGASLPTRRPFKKLKDVDALAFPLHAPRHHASLLFPINGDVTHAFLAERSQRYSRSSLPRGVESLRRSLCCIRDEVGANVCIALIDRCATAIAEFATGSRTIPRIIRYSFFFVSILLKRRRSFAWSGRNVSILIHHVHSAELECVSRWSAHPKPSESFTDRHNLVRTLANKIVQHSIGSVCLYGNPGVGKSELLLLVGDELQNRRGKNVNRLKSFSNVSDPTYLLSALQRVEPSDARDRLYLVADNIEAFADPRLWDYLLKNPLTRIVTVGAGSVSSRASPAHWFSHKTGPH